MLRISERLLGDVMILDLKGEVQAGGTERMLEDRIDSLVQWGYRKFLLNLDRVTALDSQGFGVFLMARSTVDAVHGHIVLTNATHHFLGLLEITGLLTHFQVFDSEQQALGWFSTAVDGEVEVADQRGRQAPAVAANISARMQAQRSRVAALVHRGWLGGPTRARNGLRGP